MDSFSARQSRPTTQREQQAVVQPRSADPVSVGHHSDSAKKRQKKPIKWIILGVILVLCALAALVGAKVLSGPLVDKGKYQAVFLTNGQVYFGKLSTSGGYYTLKDVYYLQTTAKATDSQNPQETTTSSDTNSVQLIKLGSEVHGPQDKMTIERSQVLFFEDLKSDGKVAQSITKYDKEKK